MFACFHCKNQQKAHESMLSDTPLCSCPECGMLFLEPQPTDEQLAEIYSKDYFLMDSSPEDQQFVASMKQKTAELYLKELLPQLQMGTEPLRLLEIGCGSGDFLVAAQAKGFDVTGIEYNQHNVTHANSKLEHDVVLQGTLEQHQSSLKPFDVCVLFDLIEHVRDPEAFIKAVFDLLKPGGTLFVVTPSLDSWSAQLLRTKWMDFKLEHLFYFNEQNMNLFLEKAGFLGIKTSPNYKVLNFDYVNRHMQRFQVPLFSGMSRLLSKAILPSFQQKNVKIVASGMSVLAHKPFTSSAECVDFSVIVPQLSSIEQLKSLEESFQIMTSEGTPYSFEFLITKHSPEQEEWGKSFPSRHIQWIDPSESNPAHVVQGMAKGRVIFLHDDQVALDSEKSKKLLLPLLQYQKRVLLGGPACFPLQEDYHWTHSWKQRFILPMVLKGRLSVKGHLVFRKEGVTSCIPLKQSDDFNRHFILNCLKHHIVPSIVTL